jgi:hypothetical protein
MEAAALFVFETCVFLRLQTVERLCTRAEKTKSIKVTALNRATAHIRIRLRLRKAKRQAFGVAHFTFGIALIYHRPLVHTEATESGWTFAHDPAEAQGHF